MLAPRNDEIDGGNQLSTNTKQYIAQCQIPLDKESHKPQYLRGPESSVIYYLQHM